MVGSALAAVASRNDSIAPTISQQSHPSRNARQDSQSPQDVEEADGDGKVRIERLGRERPTQFRSIWAEVAFCYSIVASMIMAVSGFRSMPEALLERF